MKNYIFPMLLALIGLIGYSEEVRNHVKPTEIEGKTYIIDHGIAADGSFVEEFVEVPATLDASDFTSSFASEATSQAAAVPSPRALVSLEPLPILDTGMVGAQFRFEFSSFSDFKLLPAMTTDYLANRSADDIRKQTMVAQEGEVEFDPKAVADVETRAQATEVKQSNSWLSNWGVGGAVGGVVAIVYLLSDSESGGNVNINGDNNTVSSGSSSADGGNKPSTVTGIPVTAK